ncbi:MAG: Xanthine and dehydrogenase maturation factor, XdhC/CoxF family [Polyangiaceae bacterium]|nr:Xanthine and dehydrogenase maturation factor, XdhC/CoxF family [Polyangiaceae bacterium]
MPVREILQAQLELLGTGQRGALATVVRVSGSTPQQPGARLLLREDGSTVGTVGGGAIEKAVVEALERALSSGTPELLVRDLTQDLGMCCGGRMEVFVEPLLPSPRLWLLGAGHVAKPTAALARTVGFDVFVVDEREELNNVERFPQCQLLLDDPSDALRRHPLDARDWVLIVTHDHQLDERALESAAGNQARYIGLVGSRRKVFRLVERVLAKRQGDLPVERVFAPVGLDIGAVTPEEIAVSIVAELVALRRGRPAPHLRALSDERVQRALARELA